jgi:hypothetical protein
MVGRTDATRRRRAPGSLATIRGMQPIDYTLRVADKEATPHVRVHMERSRLAKATALRGTSPECGSFGMPRGLGFATATPSAAFFPHGEQRRRGASAFEGCGRAPRSAGTQVAEGTRDTKGLGGTARGEGFRRVKFVSASRGYFFGTH